MGFLRNVVAAAIAEMPSDTEAEAMIARICEEVLGSEGTDGARPSVLTSDTLQAAKEWSKDLQAAVFKATLREHQSKLDAAQSAVYWCRLSLAEDLFAAYSTPIDQKLKEKFLNRGELNSTFWSGSAEHLSLALAELPRDTTTDRLIAQICQETCEASMGAADGCATPSLSPTFRDLAGDQEMQISVAAASRLDYHSDITDIVFAIKYLKSTDIPGFLIGELDLLDQARVLQILLEKILAKGSFFDGEPWINFADLSFPKVISALVRVSRPTGLPTELRQLVAELRERITPSKGGAANRAAKLDMLLDPALQQCRWPSGPFADAFMSRLKDFPLEKRNPWSALGEVAAKSGRSPRLSVRWVGKAEGALEHIQKREFVSEMTRWLQWKWPGRTFDPSLDLLKGFIRMIPLKGDRELAGPLGRHCERSFKEGGPRTIELGMVALRALFDLRTDSRAVAEMLRLKGVVRAARAAVAIEEYINEIAQERNKSVEDLEEETLPAFGLDTDSKLTVQLGTTSATLTVTPVGHTICWTNKGGKQIKSPSAATRREFRDELSAFREKGTDIARAIKAQTRRLERSWLESRSWALREWRTNYLEHPLRAPIVSALIWSFQRAGRTTLVLPVKGKLVDIHGDEVDGSDEARVNLWHPLDSTPDEVLSWRSRILAAGIVQPIKQAHREVYTLTDAEKATATYSNRFAAHIIRNHQFAALCSARGWSRWVYFDLNDSHAITFTWGDGSLSASFEVRLIYDSPCADSGVPLYVSTDHVKIQSHLGGRGEDVALDQVPPVIFSEVMRDVDLFVAVASIANDPAWADHQSDERMDAYWGEQAFGELGQPAQVRRELIEQIAPRLSIADKLEIGERALLVQGKRQSYAIHFGSANVQILPSNRYLCIVPDRHAPDEISRVRLPFTGDTQLSTILAKAFMLVDEDRITDRTILSQL